MNVKEKREELVEFCHQQDSCGECELKSPVCRCGKGVHFKSKDRYDGEYNMTDEEINYAYNIAILKEKFENPYWNNITEIAKKQRAKGIETYGKGLEANDKPTVERITYIEEELVDALMYLEWLKEKIEDGRE